MHLTIRILGRELLTVSTEAAEVEYDEPGVDGGYLTSYPVGFTAGYELPDGSGLPYREGWE